jgi:chemotaxis protein CheD
MNTTHAVGISECKFSSDPTDSIVTYALGSCVGLVLYDAPARIGGLLHIMLPDSRFRSSSREFNPCMYADTGFYTLIQELLSIGASKHSLVAKVAGGANMLRHSSLLDIGQRNSEAILRLAGKEHIPVLGTSLGGSVGRSMHVRLDDGATRVRLLGQGEEIL